MRCKAINKSNKERCKLQAILGDYCTVHYKIEVIGNEKKKNSNN